jgi:toxin ParE1/3/4
MSTRRERRSSPDDARLRHLLYGRKPNVYRIIYAIDEGNRVVTVLHIRHGSRKAFTTPGGG